MQENLTEKTNQSENKQAIDEEKKDFLKFDSPVEIKLILASHNSSNFGSSTSHTPAKEVHFEFTQTFSLSCSPMRNEFARSFKSITSSPTYRSLSCRLTAEDVDEIDCHCC